MRRVVEFLRKHGISVWVDNEKLVPGTPIWEEEIEKAIISAGAVVVLLSPDLKKITLGAARDQLCGRQWDTYLPYFDCRG